MGAEFTHGGKESGDVEAEVGPGWEGAGRQLPKVRSAVFRTLPWGQHGVRKSGTREWGED